MVLGCSDQTLTVQVGGRQGWAPRSFTVRSEHIVLLRSFKARNVLLHSFFEFLATYETQKNYGFFS